MSLRIKPGILDIVIPVDPDDRLDYSFDWSDFVGAEPIVGSSWVIEDDPAMSIYGETYDAATTTVYIEGGTAGVRAKVSNMITFSGVSVLYRKTASFYLQVSDH